MTNKLIFRIGLVLVVLSSILMGVLFLPDLKTSSRPKIDITGTERINENELRDTILYLIRSDKNGIREEDIKAAILMDPMVESVEVRKTGKNNLSIKIKEVESSFFEHFQDGISEKKMNEDTIQENILIEGSTGGKKVKNFGQKIVFYLTKEGTNNIVPEKIKSDIIRLWERTHIRYYGVWSNISEISFIREKDEIFSSVFPVNLHARINIYSPWDEETLRRLEAVIYLLRSSKGIGFRQVDLYEKNAFVRELKNG